MLRRGRFQLVLQRVPQRGKRRLGRELSATSIRQRDLRDEGMIPT